jgi:hypothetical protein
MIDMDLTLAPRKRKWDGLLENKSRAGELVNAYIGELDAAMASYPKALYMLNKFVGLKLPRAIKQEVAAVAALLEVDPAKLAVLNMYYDLFALYFKLPSAADVPQLLKSIRPFGCSAFAYDTADGPVHARNLDWHSENNLLSELSQVCHFRNSAPADHWYSLGWPGFFGVMTAMKPGAFSVSFNSVISKELNLLNYPSSFPLRKVMEEADCFSTALQLLVRQPVLVDCLILITGVRPGEMAVVEKQPNEARIRHPENGCIVVTNNFLAPDFLGDDSDFAEDELSSSTCTRYQALSRSLESARPHCADDCFRLLDDEEVRVEGLTMQQAVMQPSTGTFIARNAEGLQYLVQPD